MSTLESILAVDIGTVTTHLCLLDVVAGRHRLVSVAHVPTTLGMLGDDVMVGVRRGIRRLEHSAGRELLRNGRVLTPADDDRSGVDGFVACSSVAPPLGCALVGLTDGLSMGAARVACRGAGARIVAEAILGAGSRGDWASSLAGLRARHPDAIILAGGRDGGSVEGLDAAAEMLSVIYGAAGASERPGVIYAGSEWARDRVLARLDRAFDSRVVNNVLLPGEGQRPEALQRALRQMYAERLGAIAGLAELAEQSGRSVVASDEALAAAMTMLAGGGAREGSFVGIDVGASGTTFGWDAAGRYQQLRLARAPTLGLRVSAAAEARCKAVAQWLGGRQSPEEVRCALANVALRPWVVAEGDEEVRLRAADLRWDIQEAADVAGWKWEAPAGRGQTCCDVAIRGGVVTDCLREAVVYEAVVAGLGAPRDVRVVADWAAVWPQLGAVAQVVPGAALDALALDGRRVLGGVSIAQPAMAMAGVG